MEPERKWCREKSLPQSGKWTHFSFLLDEMDALSACGGENGASSLLPVTLNYFLSQPLWVVVRSLLPALCSGLLGHLVSSAEDNVFSLRDWSEQGLVCCD